MPPQPPPTSAGGAYHTANAATGDVQVASEAFFASGVVPTAAAASIGEFGTRTATVGDASTAANYITVCHATPDATCAIVTAVVVDGWPLLDINAVLDTGGGPGSRSVTAVTD